MDTKLFQNMTILSLEQATVVRFLTHWIFDNPHCTDQKVKCTVDDAGNRRHSI
jgi:hypothetical protein